MNIQGNAKNLFLQKVELARKRRQKLRHDNEERKKARIAKLKKAAEESAAMVSM